MEIPKRHNRQRLSVWNPSALAVLIVAIFLAGLAVAILSTRIAPLLLAGILCVFLLTSGMAALTMMARAHRNQIQWHSVMPCYLSIQDRDLNIIETNAMFERDFGSVSNRGKSHKCYEIYKRADEPCVNCPVLATFEDGRIHTSREYVLLKNGQQSAVVVTSAPQYDEHGKVSSVVEMSTNITELLALQQELAHVRTRYERLFDLVPGYIVVMDREFRVVETNKLARRDFGEPAGRFCYQFFKQRDSACPGCITEMSFSDNCVHYCESDVTTLDGRKINLLAYSTPIPDSEGNVTHVMEMTTDITEIKQLESQLTIIGKAVAGMAHRIKNILMGLEGGLFVVDTALESDDKEALNQGWEMVERNVELVSHIVKDLLYCSKKREADFSDGVIPESIASEILELFAERAKTDNIMISLEIGEPHPRRLDPDGIHSLITNLVTNAIDACRFDPDEEKLHHTITMIVGLDKSGATLIEVSDDGEGIKDEAANRVFEDFFSTKGNQGTGLGLLIISRVVEEHDGTITFDTHPGAGTTFRVTIPDISKSASPTVE